MESFVEIVLLLSKEWSTTPFEILAQDIDDFILLANYLVRLGKKKNGEEKVKAKKNDGFWDF